MTVLDNVRLKIYRHKLSRASDGDAESKILTKIVCSGTAASETILREYLSASDPATQRCGLAALWELPRDQHSRYKDDLLGIVRSNESETRASAIRLLPTLEDFDPTLQSEMCCAAFLEKGDLGEAANSLLTRTQFEVVDAAFHKVLQSQTLATYSEEAQRKVIEQIFTRVHDSFTAIKTLLSTWTEPHPKWLEKVILEAFQKCEQNDSNRMPELTGELAALRSIPVFRVLLILRATSNVALSQAIKRHLNRHSVSTFLEKTEAIENSILWLADPDKAVREHAARDVILHLYDKYKKPPVFSSKRTSEAIRVALNDSELSIVPKAAILATRTIGNDEHAITADDLIGAVKRAFPDGYESSSDSIRDDNLFTLHCGGDFLALLTDDVGELLNLADSDFTPSRLASAHSLLTKKSNGKYYQDTMRRLATDVDSNIRVLAAKKLNHEQPESRQSLLELLNDETAIVATAACHNLVSHDCPDITDHLIQSIRSGQSDVNVQIRFLDEIAERCDFASFANLLSVSEKLAEHSGVDKHLSALTERLLREDSHEYISLMDHSDTSVAAGATGLLATLEDLDDTIQDKLVELLQNKRSGVVDAARNSLISCGDAAVLSKLTQDFSEFSSTQKTEFLIALERSGGDLRPLLERDIREPESEQKQERLIALLRNGSYDSVFEFAMRQACSAAVGQDSLQKLLGDTVRSDPKALLSITAAATSDTCSALSKAVALVMLHGHLDNQSVTSAAEAGLRDSRRVVNATSQFLLKQEMEWRDFLYVLAATTYCGAPQEILKELAIRGHDLNRKEREKVSGSGLSIGASEDEVAQYFTRGLKHLKEHSLASDLRKLREENTHIAHVASKAVKEGLYLRTFSRRRMTRNQQADETKNATDWLIGEFKSAFSPGDKGLEWVKVSALREDELGPCGEDIFEDRDSAGDWLVPTDLPACVDNGVYIVVADEIPVAFNSETDPDSCVLLFHCDEASAHQVAKDLESNFGATSVRSITDRFDLCNSLPELLSSHDFRIRKTRYISILDGSDERKELPLQKAMPARETAKQLVEEARHHMRVGGLKVKALSLLNQAVDADPDFADAYDARANVYASMGGSEEALADMKKLGELKAKGEEVTGDNRISGIPDSVDDFLKGFGL